RVLGIDIVDDPDLVRSRVGVVLDEPGLYEHLSALDNLRFWARVWSVPDERIELLLRGIGLWDRRLDRAGSWSRGMQQQLALIRAQLHDPELLFLDEPTAGLDVLSARNVRSQLRVLTDAGKSVFLITHNMTEAEELCDRVAVI
ncbi:MAG: ABC transporter ATP-binding protein, partial [Acidimicrobiia bacterium]|nr:ABC transporter ATP-binding protein [Acidimicrobiia bacterium]